MRTFGRRNLWHGAFSKSFSAWVFNKHREKDCIRKFNSPFVLALHQIWIEIFSMFHETKCSRIIIEDNETLMRSVERILDMHEALLSELEVHRGKVDAITSELLGTFLRKLYALTDGNSSSTLLTNDTLNSATKFRPEISEVASDFRNDATRLRHENF